MAALAALDTPPSPSRAAADSLRVAAEPGFDFAGAEYTAFFRTARASAFQHPLWLDRLYRHLAPGRGARKLAVTGRDDAGALRFVLPLILRRRRGVRLLEAADLGVGDYAAPVLAADWQAPAGLAARVGAVLPGFDLLRIKPIRAETLADWQAFFAARARRLDFSAHAVALGDNHAAFRDTTLPESFARTLKRKLRKLERAGDVAFERLTDPAEAAASIAALSALRAGRFAGDPIQTPAVQAFYAAVAADGAADGFARTYRLSLDGAPIGHLFGLGLDGRFHYLLIGCDYDRHGRLSPGLAMYDRTIAEWIGAGGRIFDFTIGDEPFKRDFGTRPTAMWALSAAGSPLGRLALVAMALRRPSAGGGQDD